MTTRPKFAVGDVVCSTDSKKSRPLPSGVVTKVRAPDGPFCPGGPRRGWGMTVKWDPAPVYEYLALSGILCERYGGTEMLMSDQMELASKALKKWSLVRDVFKLLSVDYTAKVAVFCVRVGTKRYHARDAWRVQRRPKRVGACDCVAG